MKYHGITNYNAKKKKKEKGTRTLHDWFITTLHKLIRSIFGTHSAGYDQTGIMMIDLC